MPHAMCRLCPTTTPASPGMVTPATSRPGACRCAMYQIPGSEYSRCISFESSGLPDAVWLPAMAQALDPRYIPGFPYALERCRSRCSHPEASQDGLCEAAVDARGGKQSFLAAQCSSIIGENA